MRVKTIRETISVDSIGNATCEQEIEYLNSGSEELIFPSLLVTRFDIGCKNFIFQEVPYSSIKPVIVSEEDQPYQKELVYEIQGKIASQGNAKVLLKYLWDEFRGEAGFKRIATEFDSLTNYNLEIRVDDDTFSDYLIDVYDGDNALGLKKDYYVTKEGNLYITRQNISQNSKMDIKIKAKIRIIELPVVKEVAKESQKCIQEKYVVLTILHLLRDSIPFFEGLLSMGVKKNDLFILGIPYSSKDEVIEHLCASGYQVQKTDNIDYFSNFTEHVKKLLQQALDQCAGSSKKLLIIEDGGYAVPMLHKEYDDYLHLCYGAVEQTANGIWEDQILEASGMLKIPVMNVAECDLKKEREAPLVGQAIIKNINGLLETYGQNLKDQRVGQIGFGTIGAETAQIMKNDGVNLTIFDISPTQRKEARRACYKVVTDLDKLLNFRRSKKHVIYCNY